MVEGVNIFFVTSRELHLVILGNVRACLISWQEKAALIRPLISCSTKRSPLFGVPTVCILSNSSISEPQSSVCAAGQVFVTWSHYRHDSQHVCKADVSTVPAENVLNLEVIERTYSLHLVGS